MARQYELTELVFCGEKPAGSEAQTDLSAVFRKDGKETCVRGFYAGDGIYKVRFLPEETGKYTYSVKGSMLDQKQETPVNGELIIDAAAEDQHGPVRAEGIHLRHADGTWFYSFGTTVYALAHQSEALIEETMETLKNSPFNKVRMCVFPKHYNYNHNNPEYYAFARSAAGEGKTFEAEEGSEVAPMKTEADEVNNWDVHHPCFAFWDAFEEKIARLCAMGIQVDLILFHPYDRWGFSTMPHADDLVYLDYLLRRLSAFPNVWWSLANEYDLCVAKSIKDWEDIEAFVAANDPFHHMLSNHNCLCPWDWGREHVTHVSWQSQQFTRVGELERKYGKPVLFDECRYEGNVPESWGNISGQEMTANFWKVTTQGGYCTHGETFYPGTEPAKENTHTSETEVVWWARGGRLHGESPARIAFLREIMESLPGPISAIDVGFGAMYGKTDEEMQQLIQMAPAGFRSFAASLLAMGAVERDKMLVITSDFGGATEDGSAFLYYKDTQCSAKADLRLPQEGSYRIDVIDTWEMTRDTVLHGASGSVRIDLPGKPYMAILAVRE